MSMSGTDVAEDTVEENPGQETLKKTKAGPLTFLRIWLPFPLMLGAILYFQYRSNPTDEAAPEESGGLASAFEGAGEELPALMQAVVDERADLAKEREELRFAQRRILLEQSEIAARQEEVEDLLSRVEAKMGVMEEERDRMLTQLARVYETMKADAAAVILSGLEVETSTEILRRMKERSAAQVMASLEPQAAARISQRMLRQQ
jgi:flagellar motility protein MotE (MotC chaperone)